MIDALHRRLIEQQDKKDEPMSRRVELLILAVLAAVCGLQFWHMIDYSIGPHIARGSGPDGVSVSSLEWVVTAITGLGTAGFSGGLILKLAADLIARIPAVSPWKWFAKNAMNVGQVAIYQQSYKGAKSPEERATIRRAAKLASDSLFDEMFPVDVPAVEGGAK